MSPNPKFVGNLSAYFTSSPAASGFFVVATGAVVCIVLAAMKVGWLPFLFGYALFALNAGLVVVVAKRAIVVGSSFSKAAFLFLAIFKLGFLALGLWLGLVSLKLAAGPLVAGAALALLIVSGLTIFRMLPMLRTQQFSRQPRS